MALPQFLIGLVPAPAVSGGIAKWRVPPATISGAKPRHPSPQVSSVHAPVLEHIFHCWNTAVTYSFPTAHEAGKCLEMALASSSYPEVYARLTSCGFSPNRASSAYSNSLGAAAKPEDVWVCVVYHDRTSSQLPRPPTVVYGRGDCVNLTFGDKNTKTTSADIKELAVGFLEGLATVYEGLL